MELKGNSAVAYAEFHLVSTTDNRIKNKVVILDPSNFEIPLFWTCEATAHQKIISVTDQ